MRRRELAQGPRMKPNNRPDMPNLDFLRACAVCFVVGHHLFIFFPTIKVGLLNFSGIGYWGVLIFFVHTSFVLTLSLHRQAQQRPGRRLLWPFLIRRTFRIFPLSILIVLLVYGLNLPVGHVRPGSFVPVHVSLWGFLSNLFLVQNLTHTESVMSPLWSLPYEMQMYLVLPALFVLARSARTAWPLFGVWAIGFIAAVRPWYFERHGVPDLIEYVPYFLAGIIGYRCMATPTRQVPSILWPVFLAAVSALYLRDTSAADGRGPICCLLIGLAIPRFAQLQQPSVVAISNRVARYSYGIYLTHFICIWFAFQALGNLQTGARWLVFIASMSLIPIALHHTLEAPMIRLGQRVASCLRDRSREAGHRADTQAGTVFLQREDRVRSREAAPLGQESRPPVTLFRGSEADSDAVENDGEDRGRRPSGDGRARP